MKICPLCAKIYRDEMNYCLEDGEILRHSAASDHAENTIQYNPAFAAPTGENKNQTDFSGGAAAHSGRTDMKTANLPAPESKFKRITAVLVIVFVTLLSAVIYGGFTFYRAVKNQVGIASNVNRNGLIIPGQRIPQAFPTTEYGTLKVEVGERVKDNFGKDYVKCMVTNTGEKVVKKPSVKLTLYKNDVKIGDASGDSDLEYLKPEQTIPIWIDLSEKENKFTSAKVDETVKYEIAKKDAAILFPSLVYTDTKLTNDLRTSLLNFKPYKEMFYTVAGTVENRQSEKTDAKIYVIFRDKQGEIIGIDSTNPPELKKNEKAEFTASVGGMNLFGIPADYELIAVDDN